MEDIENKSLVPVDDLSKTPQVKRRTFLEAAAVMTRAKALKLSPAARSVVQNLASQVIAPNNINLSLITPADKHITQAKAEMDPEFEAKVLEGQTLYQGEIQETEKLIQARAEGWYGDSLKDFDKDRIRYMYKAIDNLPMWLKMNESERASEIEKILSSNEAFKALYGVTLNPKHRLPDRAFLDNYLWTRYGSGKK